MEELSQSSLFKDILSLEGVHKPKLLKDLFSQQVGSELSTSELSQSLKTSREQAFIIFALPSYSSNERREIKKRKKAYFYDTGILNVLREDTTPLSMRSGPDIAPLWENYLIAERKKLLVNQSFGPNQYFWRNANGARVDYLEVHQGAMRAWELTWKAQKSFKTPSAFAALYPQTPVELVDSATYDTFLL